MVSVNGNTIEQSEQTLLQNLLPLLKNKCFKHGQFDLLHPKVLILHDEQKFEMPLNGFETSTCTIITSPLTTAESWLRSEVAGWE